MKSWRTSQARCIALRGSPEVRLLLLSGGMDSICVASWLRPDAALTINYGQTPAAAELAAAKAVSAALGMPHHVLDVDCAVLGSGDLAGRPALASAPCSEWWPFRNQLLVTLAAMFSAGHGFDRILLGTVASDTVHKDGTAEFVHQLSALLASQEGGITVEAPAAGLTASELVAESGASRSLLSWAHSCHVSNLACGQCRGCLKHFDTWKRLGWPAH